MRSVVALRSVAESEDATSAPRPEVSFCRERFIDIVTELGPLMRLHDAEIWPSREWGPKGAVRFNVVQYLMLGQRGALHIITARAEGALVGYCFEAIEPDDHYGMLGSVNCGFFLKKEYRAGPGLAFRRHGACRFLAERERLLDELKVERRRIGVKTWLDFGPLLKLFGYEPDMIQYHKTMEH
jgi:hypothetical protein